MCERAPCGTPLCKFWAIWERLYREIRPLRIYEGATEVQLLMIARELMKDVPAG